MFPLLLFSLAFFLILSTTPSSARHVTNINSSTLQFSSLVWDPTTQHFIAGSALGPTVYAIPVKGTVKCLLLEPFSNSSTGTVSVTALAIDKKHLRLIVAFSNPSSVSAYDLKSYRRIYAVPLPELDGAPSGVVVDLESGDVFVNSAKRGVVLKVGFQGESKKVISKIFGDKRLDGIAYLSHGYILVLQTTIGKIFKVDMIDGTMKDIILLRDSSILLEPSVHAIALQTEKSIVIATNQSLFLIESDDNSWAGAASIHKKMKMKMKEGEIVLAVTMREGENAYVLVKSLKGYKIEEVVWGEKSIMGFALVFLYVVLCVAVCIWLIFFIIITCRRFTDYWREIYF